MKCIFALGGPQYNEALVCFLMEMAEAITHLFCLFVSKNLPCYCLSGRGQNGKSSRSKTIKLCVRNNFDGGVLKHITHI